MSAVTALALTGPGNVAIGGPLGSGSRTATVVLTRAQILALNTTPVTLIPAQGTRANICSGPAMLQLANPSGTAFVAGGASITIQYAALAQLTAFSTGFDSALTFATTSTSASTFTVGNFLNTAITISASGPITGGGADSTVTISLSYYALGE